VKVILLVTLIVAGQPPHTYQIGDMTRLHCDLAKTNLEKEYARAFSKLNVTYSILCIETPRQP
jgi:hypothetical protein